MYIMELKNFKYGKIFYFYLKFFNKDCVIYNFLLKYIIIGMYDWIYIFIVKIVFN